MQLPSFENHALPPMAEALRGDLRAFLREALRGLSPATRSQSWMGFDAEFSERLGAQGWIGMTWPRQFGGQERTALERYVVLEELLAAGAPVGAHWIADRQTGPVLLRYGNQEQRERFLPAIAQGKCFFCIGMSEPDSGSDLASIRTTAKWSEGDGGWILNGTKVWTTSAHLCHFMVTLVRTGTDPKARHDGLSQLIVELGSPGVTVRPIKDLAGGHHFNEVVFQNAFVPDSRRIGEEGQGWNQVMAELAFERSGPERYLSSFQLLEQLVTLAGREPRERVAVTLGRLIARARTLRAMSISVAGMLEAGQDPSLEAAVVKDLGTNFEQELPELAHDLFGREPTDGGSDDFLQVLAYLTQHAPSFSLRGGTREILRGIIARGLGLR